MASANALLQLKEKFESDQQWQDFLNFIESQKVRGDANELWLQWEIHMLKCQSMKNEWHSSDHYYLSSGMRASSTQFQ